MKYFTLLFLVLSLSVNAAEIRTQADWQQRVDYTIQVSLDDVNHVLNGWVKMVYKNNSPHRLDSIYMHLWPNAYSSRTTDFAEQQLINGKTGFHYSEWSERGSIDSLNFTVAGKSATYYKLPGQPDIAVLKLNQPLDPGSIVEIETPFRVKIPGSFSRFGHVDQDYQITQWFPKPAVYDVNGWNPMPYLDQGEFYSEFGKFEVKITVPKNYLVAATGELQEESEWTFIRKRRDNPIDKFEGWASSSETKTLTYIQDNIHDFAWFASKYFNVQEDEVELEGGSKVGTFVFAPVKKINSTKDIASALQFYSKNCGTYPYRYCTVVQGPIKAGGGMEYPMITVVASLGEEVIVHEVGHNWFYGILGSNERRYPWMDESINTYFESQTMHAGSGMTADLDKPRFDATQANDQGMNLLARWMERQEMHQPIGLQSDLFTGLNYGVMVYGKGAMSFGHLHAYLGEETFYNCFRTYFNEWKFRHPLPNDMKTVFEAVSQDDLSWFFDGIITTEGHLDYKVVKTEGNAVIIQNSGMVEAPYPIGLFNKGEFVMEMWQPGHRGEVKVELPSGMEIDLVKIDPYGIMQESNVKNNTIRMTGMLKKVEPIRVGLYAGQQDNNHNPVYVGPILGWNQYNKTMFGLVISNSQFPSPKFYYAATPMYSSQTGDINGYGRLAYHHLRNKVLNEVEYGFNAARFAYQPFNLYSYNRIAPYVELKFRNADKRFTNKTKVKLRYVYTSFDPQFDETANIAQLAMDTASFNRRTVDVNDPDQFIDLTIEKSDGKTIDPMSFKLNVQYGHTANTTHRYDTAVAAITQMQSQDDFVKINLTINRRVNYNLKKKGMDIRVFLGGYIKTPTSGLYQYRLGSQSGRYDYTFEQAVMGRNATDGLYRNQIVPNEMNLKLVGNFGNIPGYVASANIVSDVPGKLPLKVYLDLFNYQDIQTAPNNVDNEKIGYTGGVNVSVIPKILEIYFPLISSGFLTETQNVQGLKDYNQRISFVLNLNRLVSGDLNNILSKAF